MKGLWKAFNKSLLIEEAFKRPMKTFEGNSKAFWKFLNWLLMAYTKPLKDLQNACQLPMLGHPVPLVPPASGEAERIWELPSQRSQSSLWKMNDQPLCITPKQREKTQNYPHHCSNVWYTSFAIAWHMLSSHIISVHVCLLICILARSHMRTYACAQPACMCEVRFTSTHTWTHSCAFWKQMLQTTRTLLSEFGRRPSKRYCPCM